MISKNVCILSPYDRYAELLGNKTRCNVTQSTKYEYVICGAVRPGIEQQ